MRLLLLVFVFAVAASARADCGFAESFSQVHRHLADYPRTFMARDGGKSPAYYRRTFERAVRGDTVSLRIVFRCSDFHSGDNEAWESVPWWLLSVIGDNRFADFLASLPASERDHILRTFGHDVAWFGHCDGARFDRYVRDHFPRFCASYFGHSRAGLTRR